MGYRGALERAIIARFGKNKRVDKATTIAPGNYDPFNDQQRARD